MMASEFMHPEWLSGLAIGLAVACGAVAWSSARARWRVERLLARRDRGARRRAISDAALCLALGALALGLAGPRWAWRDVQITTSGTDLVILFDGSRSMDAADNPPSRMSRARRAAVEILDGLAPGSRAALAAFADRGVLLTPLTPDRRALIELIPAIDTDLIHPGGSNLVDGLRAALEAYEENSRRPRVLVVLSDGEVRPAIDSDAVGRLDKAGVRALSVGLGRAHGHTLPDGGVPLRDGRGELVVSRRVVRSLETLADETGGRLWLADDWGEVDLAALVSEIERDSRAASDSGDGTLWRRVRAPLVMPFAALAFALLAGEALLGGRASMRSRLGLGYARRLASAVGRAIVRRPRRAVAASAALAVLVPFLLGAGRPDDPLERIERLEGIAQLRRLRADELVELGVARFEGGKATDAEHALRAAALAALESERHDWAALAYHDLGVIALDRGDRETARDLFFEAVALDPNESRSRYNLEWTLRSLATPDAPPMPSPTGDEPPDEDPRQRPEPGGDGTDRENEPELEAELPSPKGADRPPPALVVDPNSQAEAPLSPGAGRPPRQVVDIDAAARWLERVDDDPSRALRSATEHDPSERRPRRSQPAW